MRPVDLCVKANNNHLQTVSGLQSYLLFRRIAQRAMLSGSQSVMLTSCVKKGCCLFYTMLGAMCGPLFFEALLNS